MKNYGEFFRASGTPHGEDARPGNQSDVALLAAGLFTVEHHLSKYEARLRGCMHAGLTNVLLGSVLDY